MVKFGKKFFFDENSDSSKKSNTKSAYKKQKKKAQGSSRFSIKMLFNKIRYYFKKAIPFLLIIGIIILIIVGTKFCSNNKSKKDTNDNSTSNKHIKREHFELYYFCNLKGI